MAAALPDITGEEVNVWEALREDVQVELEQSQRELREIDLLLEQSQVEVNKLTQRNQTITMHLQQVQSQLDDSIVRHAALGGNAQPGGEITE